MWPSEANSAEAMWETEANDTTPQTANPDMADAEALVHLLASGGLYVRTGLLLLPAHWLGREGEIAVRLGATHVNYQQWKANRLAEGQTFLLLSPERLIDDLDQLCLESHARTTLLISLLDLPLTALHPAERTRFWEFLHGTFSKRSRYLLLALPDTAIAALPAGLRRWQAGGRVAHWQL